MLDSVCLQVDPTQMGPIERASLCLQTSATTPILVIWGNQGLSYFLMVTPCFRQLVCDSEAYFDCCGTYASSDELIFFEDSHIEMDDCWKVKI
jgi:hypothetical protein